jgi:hypothetical protein
MHFQSAILLHRFFIPRSVRTPIVSSKEYSLFKTSISKLCRLTLPVQTYCSTAPLEERGNARQVLSHHVLSVSAGNMTFRYPDEDKDS